ncbi:Haloacid dehalogenase-like hydrolase (HAD) superfamily protein [Raphanus sativus]|uniref:5-amino-6-(5-phospho-D-ribitylamino)uracil phosphatase, chloroplastic n=1 Tax=Raphanus sativus TaxID=3726 RepID=A0A6J0NV18_RAPSA|nr:5-amino-6-(5-phospho-D-ribitylamino)uracil phosphatase, chloroplastic [Raphanus sativus]KAJ4876296.1 Haloacid dehalogenase-like hydrolase (HAD) superfamily protein [Raphanus sativus]
MADAVSLVGSIVRISVKNEARTVRFPVKGVVFDTRKKKPMSVFPIKALAMELTKEMPKKKKKKDPRTWNYLDSGSVDKWPPPENKADKPSLHNPLLRQERMGCGWLGAIFEWEGVLIEDNPGLEGQSWLTLAQEEGKSPPPAFLLRRIEGMKNEQAVSEVLCWSRDPAQVRRMASRKEEIFKALDGGVYRLRDGSQEFVNVLMNNKIPMALVSTRPRETLENAVGSIGIRKFFSVIVASEDVHRGKPDPEMFAYAAQLLDFIPERCIVFGNSNQTIEAAHDGKMKCVAVASKHPMYELGAADLVVRRLDELSVIDLKKLAAVELTEFEPELEMEKEDERELPSSNVAVDDFF